MNNNTLIIAMSSYAGMGPYVATIVNSFSPNDPVWFVLGDDERHFYSKNIKKELKDKCLIYHKEKSKWDKLRELFLPDSVLGKQIDNVIKSNGIRNIHFLTDAISLCAYEKKWSKTCHIIYTVHDLHPHDVKKAMYKMWKHKRFYGLVSQMIDCANVLVTNSQSQYEEMKLMYSNQETSFHGFPTLITDEITKGATNPPELNGISKYVLFFGRIEAYKGLDILYHAWTENDELKQDYTLVIAGSGDLYFPIDANERSVKIINRYIADSEIASLYNNAACCVYPYISASQSGVLSLSCYFKTPIVASDVPFFKGVDEDGIGVTFKNGDTKDLAQKLKHILVSDNSKIKQRQSEYYASRYDAKSIRLKLMEIYGQN